MSRKNPVTVIYMLINRVNGKFYIGETFDLATRMSYYKSTPQRVKSGWKPNTKIYKAIDKYGFDAFDLKILADKESYPDIQDWEFRCELESQFIREYDALNPDIAYNSIVDDFHPEYKIMKRKKRGVKHTPYTKIIKSNPVFVYDSTDQSITIALGKLSAGKLIGIDKATASHCVIRGKMTKHYFLYAIDPNKRYQYAKKMLDNRYNEKKKIFKHNNITTEYIRGLKRVEKFIKKWDMKCSIDIDELLSNYQ